MRGHAVKKNKSTDVTGGSFDFPIGEDNPAVIP
jgi:hypothetical protein